MEAAKIFLKNLADTSESSSNIFKRNILKEYLHILVLDYLYSHPKYNKLVFYGGSCLSHCFGLPRLSEDLDFVDLKSEIDIFGLAKDIHAFFKNNTDLEAKPSVQKFRIYLKFPLLRELGLAGQNESDLLFLKIEIFKKFNFCTGFAIETIPLFKFNKTLVVKTFDLSTLMSTKIMAILQRKWEKTSKSGEVLAKVKGRDYFDLMWYLEKGVKPNINCIEGVSDAEELKEKLLKIIGTLDVRGIKLDLAALIGNENFVKNISRNLKDILKRDINKL